MSEHDPNRPDQPASGSAPDPGEHISALTGDDRAGEGVATEREDPMTRRAASVRLRGGQDRSAPDASLMDPAHQSLADALRITLRIVQMAMVVLVAFFLFSGARTIQEGESGVRLVFGRVQAENLPPGFQFSWPFPIGDLIKVETGNERLTIAEAFWPALTEGGQPQPVDQLRSARSLDPARMGSLITADGSLVHTAWQVTYRRVPEQASDYVRHLHPDTERRIIRAAVRRGVVHAVAQHEIGEVLREAGGGSLAVQARQLAQDQLDLLRAGISVENLDLDDATPPKVAREAFNRVLSAEQEASQTISEARSQAEQRLLNTAGQIHGELLTVIEDEFRPAADKYQLAVREFRFHLEDAGITASDDRAERVAGLVDEYEDLHAEAARARAGGESDRAERLAQERDGVRDRIVSIVPETGDLLDRRAELALERERAMSAVHEIFQRPTVGGRVARMINDAEFYAETEGTRRQSDLETYLAMLDQFRRNPLVTIHGNWSDALQAFMSGDHVQAMLTPRDTEWITVRLNRDPEVTRRQEQAAKERRLDETRRQRERMRRQAEFQTETSTGRTPQR